MDKKKTLKQKKTVSTKSIKSKIRKNRSVGGSFGNLTNKPPSCEHPSCISSNISLNKGLRLLGHEHIKTIQKYPSKDKIIGFSWDGAGMSNTRMAIEVIFGLSIIYDRTIILPPTGYWHHISNKDKSCCKLEDFYDINALKSHFKVYTSKEWFNKELTIEEYKDYFSKNDDLFLEKKPFLLDYYNDQFKEKQTKKIWYINSNKTRLFGNMDGFFKNSHHLQNIRNKIKNGFKFKKDILKIVEKCLNQNGITNVGTFNAIHFRGTDFERFRPNNSGKKGKNDGIYNMLNNFDTKIPLLIATDDPTKIEFLKNNYPNIVFMNKCNVPPKYKPLIDLISCTMAQKFIGTTDSTFTHHIQILRGYLSKNINTINPDLLYLQSWGKNQNVRQALYSSDWNIVDKNRWN